MRSTPQSVLLDFLKIVRPQVDVSEEKWRNLSIRELNLDSLDRTTLCLDIEDGVGVEVRIEDLDGFATLGLLHDWLAVQIKER